MPPAGHQLFGTCLVGTLSIQSVTVPLEWILHQQLPTWPEMCLGKKSNPSSLCSYCSMAPMPLGVEWLSDGPLSALTASTNDTERSMQTLGPPSGLSISSCLFQTPFPRYHVSKKCLTSIKERSIWAHNLRQNYGHIAPKVSRQTGNWVLLVLGLTSLPYSGQDSNS